MQCSVEITNVIYMFRIKDPRDLFDCENLSSNYAMNVSLYLS